ncbi:MAG: PEP-CTERM sorting domain-containing protein [Planctomycetaceae bacterium]|nr:PEP-CTERM sorting domain-containing protein [Planctomycetaceae bacterium]
MMRTFQTLLPCCLVCAYFGIAGSTQAALSLSYDVNIVEAGPVALGSTINWEVYATVAGAPDVGSNFGIAQASVTIGDSFGETMSTGTVSPAFQAAAPGFNSGGTYNGGTMQLELIGAFDFTQDGNTVGNAGPGSFLLASGSYVVTQLGTHTLQAFATADQSTYFTAAGQSGFLGSPYDGGVTFGSDSIVVQAAVVPEPASLTMLGLACLGGGIVQVRRRRKDGVNTQSV